MNHWHIDEAQFKSWDETELFYRIWKPQQPSQKALIILHRGHEHSGRLKDLVASLALYDFWAFSFDLRGHGNSPGERGYAESYDVWIKDLDAFAKMIHANYGIAYEDMAIVANSVSAVTTVAWVHDYASRIRCLVLAAPAFRIKLYIPFAIPLLRLLQKIKGKAFIKSYVKSSMLTHDPHEIQRYDDDPLITRNIAVNILLGLYDTATRILADAGAIYTPTLILSAGSDYVVKTSAQRKFYKAISSKIKAFHVYPKFYHAIFYESGKEDPITKARDFILESFGHKPDCSFLLDADTKGYTKQEYDLLSSPTNLMAGIYYSLQRVSLKTLGKLSKGIQLGWLTGFDSGKSLDYVYENKAQGITPLGRFIDRCYLNTIGWKGIRQRKVHLIQSLKEVINRIAHPDGKVRIVDVASGPGRYLLEFASEVGDKNLALQLRDHDEKNLDTGKKLAEKMGLQNIEFVKADAFDPNSLAEISPKPHIIVVSGLYELFPGNAMILKSLRGISEALEEGGYLIYTCQPWHPQVEMIARTLINRDGKPWIMRRRTQAEMDELVRSVGLNKLDMKIDEYGIFTVSIAQK